MERRLRIHIWIGFSHLDLQLPNLDEARLAASVQGAYSVPDNCNAMRRKRNLRDLDICQRPRSFCRRTAQNSSLVVLKVIARVETPKQQNPAFELGIKLVCNTVCLTQDRRSCHTGHKDYKKS